MGAPAKPFSYLDCLRRADEILSRPPEHDWIQRTNPTGALVARFALPLELAKPQNQTRHSSGWKLGKIKKAAYLMMLAQNNGRVESEPLPGRPTVRATRFSSVAPDAYNDGAKIAIDRLCVGKMGLGFLRDDRPQDALVIQSWEPAPRGQGFLLVEVFEEERR